MKYRCVKKVLITILLSHFWGRAFIKPLRRLVFSSVLMVRAVKSNLRLCSLVYWRSLYHQSRYTLRSLGLLKWIRHLSKTLLYPDDSLFSGILELFRLLNPFIDSRVQTIPKPLGLRVFLLWLMIIIWWLISQINLNTILICREYGHLLNLEGRLAVHYHRLHVPTSLEVCIWISSCLLSQIHHSPVAFLRSFHSCTLDQI